MIVTRHSGRDAGIQSQGCKTTGFRNIELDSYAIVKLPSKALDSGDPGRLWGTNAVKLGILARVGRFLSLNRKAGCRPLDLFPLCRQTLTYQLMLRTVPLDLSIVARMEPLAA